MDKITRERQERLFFMRMDKYVEKYWMQKPRLVRGIVCQWGVGF